MRKYVFYGLCGVNGSITEHSNGSATLLITAGESTYEKRFITLQGAKVALGGVSENCLIKEVAA